MRFLKLSNKNWKRLRKGEIQAKQLEINLKEIVSIMTEQDEGKKVKVISIDSEDEKYGIQVGDVGEIDTVYICINDLRYGKRLLIPNG